MALRIYGESCSCVQMIFKTLAIYPLEAGSEATLGVDTQDHNKKNRVLSRGSPHPHRSDAPSAMKENWLFIGNPGTGKSTLLNCLAKRVVFTSGVSYDGSLTKAPRRYVDRTTNVVYTDTPGLATVTAEQAAADAITRALRTGTGQYKLCFVIGLECGRIVCQDMVTIERVLDSISVRNVPFGIIINNISVAQCATLSTKLDEFKRVVTLINSGKYSTPHVLIVPSLKALVEADNKIVELPRGVRKCIEAIPTVKIPPHAVRDIVVPGFATAVQQVEENMTFYKNNEYAVNLVEMELEDNKPGFWDVALKTMKVVAQVAVFVAGCLL